jgi:hypothetical protein
VLGARVVLEGRPVEPVELVVEDPGEAERHDRGAGLEGLGQRERRPLGLLVELDPSRRAVVPLDERGLVEVELDGVQHHGGRRLVHDDVDVDGAGERGPRQVRCERQVVALGRDVPGEPMGIGVVDHGRRLSATSGPSAGAR